MATSKKYLSLEEAASLLKIKTDELIRLREKGEIRGFADRGTWKFKGDDVDEFVRRRQPDSDPDVPIIDDLDAGPSNVISDDDDDLGRQPTVIRKGRSESASDSDVRLLLDPGMKGLTGSSGDMPIVAPQSDSDVRLLKEPSPVPRRQSDSDSDVKLINPTMKAPDSDSDVKLVDPVRKRKGDSDSDVKLAGSDSDVKLVTLEDSDSDVKLAPPPLAEQSSDSDVALLPPIKRGSGKPSDSALFDDDPGLTLPADSGIQLSGDSGIQLVGRDSGIRLSAPDSGIRLGGDSGIRLSDDSGIQLQQPADSGILLEGHDSGLMLDSGDSGIMLSEDSGMKLRGGSSKKLKGSSSKNLKGRKPKDELETTTPMMLAQDVQSDDDLSATSPMLLQHDDDLSGEDLEVPLLTDDEESETSVIMFDDEESDQGSPTVVKKGRRSVDESAFDLEDEESMDEELEVSDEVLGEDDELEDLDAFASDEDEFDESFESGASRIGFAAGAGKIAAPQEVEWSTMDFMSVLTTSFVLLAAAIISVDLLRTTWGAGDTTMYQGELLGMIGDMFK